MRGRVSGLTLMELLVVLAIIALLAALLMPVVRSARYRAGDTVCISNMRQLLAALNMYKNDHGGYPPNRFNRVLPYVKDHGIFYCPVEKDARYVSVSRVMEGIPNLSYMYAGTHTFNFSLFLRLVAPLDPNHGILTCVWHPMSNLDHPFPAFAPHIRRGRVDGSVQTVKKRAPAPDEPKPHERGGGCIVSWLDYTDAPCPREFCYHPDCTLGD